MRRLTSLAYLLVALSISLLSLPLQASSSGTAPYYIPEVRSDVTNIESLRQGSIGFFSICVACHSLKFMRYQRIADDLGWTEEELRASGALPTGKTMNDYVSSQLTEEAALATYGIIPPDLSLKAREKGTAWLHAFLSTFYADADSKTNFNNAVVPGTAMPNIFVLKQGLLEPVYKTEESGKKVLTGLELKRAGTDTEKEFYNRMRDVVSFLEYASEPSKIARLGLAPFVFLFLCGLIFVLYLVKRAYWTDIH